MNKKGFIARAAVGAIGGALLLGGAGAALADEVDDQDVDVAVSIEALEPVGALTMSVAPGSATLEEVESTDPDIRQFDGVLPTVTVTDDREEVPTDVGWYVTGQSSALTAAGGLTIPAGHLGWVPAILTEEGNGEVAVGPEVDTVLDEGPNNVGLVSQELLALVTIDSGDAATVGTWQANANLFLKTPVDIAPGDYSGTITLTLWENALQ
ncbi:hypothetical protein [Microbacterium sp. SLBN-146]|uniref:hypothetical protein n=1 Tax=Microbacterium sp. SLBN-146 TaxID=2768457 RepID=UPI00114E0F25|nr:hypothetical protein [Microbacterium sp. SLBN-146]TQJ30849.1 hypothetical protein FBY39_1306 [Microbacterium sp. SLBN-146]